MAQKRAQAVLSRNYCIDTDRGNYSDTDFKWISDYIEVFKICFATFLICLNI